MPLTIMTAASNDYLLRIFSIELIFHLNYLNLPFHIGIFNFMKIANAKKTTKNTITIFYQSNIFDYYIMKNGTITEILHLLIEFTFLPKSFCSVKG